MCFNVCVLIKEIYHILYILQSLRNVNISEERLN